MNKDDTVGQLVLAFTGTAFVTHTDIDDFHIFTQENKLTE